MAVSQIRPSIDFNTESGAKWTEFYIWGIKKVMNDSFYVIEMAKVDQKANFHQNWSFSDTLKACTTSFPLLPQIDLYIC